MRTKKKPSDPLHYLKQLDEVNTGDLKYSVTIDDARKLENLNDFSCNIHALEGSQMSILWCLYIILAAE